MRFMHPLFRAVYVGGGLGLITRLPRLYRLAYHVSDQPAVDRVLRGPRYRTQQISTRALRRTIESFQPDVIVCTHFLAAELCAGWRRSGQLRVPVYTVITDFDPHFMWQHAGTDGYCVPTEAARDRLRSRWHRSGDHSRHRHPDRSAFCRPARSACGGPPLAARSRSPRGLDHGRRVGRGADGIDRAGVAHTSARGAARLHHRAAIRRCAAS